jgi:hypothetical protein
LVHEHVDSENLAETFIGKLFSKNWNKRAIKRINQISKSPLILSTNVQPLQIHLH